MIFRDLSNVVQLCHIRLTRHTKLMCHVLAFRSSNLQAGKWSDVGKPSSPWLDYIGINCHHQTCTNHTTWSYAVDHDLLLRLLNSIDHWCWQEKMHRIDHSGYFSWPIFIKTLPGLLMSSHALKGFLCRLSTSWAQYWAMIVQKRQGGNGAGLWSQYW